MAEEGVGDEVGGGLIRGRLEGANFRAADLLLVDAHAAGAGRQRGAVGDRLAGWAGLSRVQAAVPQSALRPRCGPGLAARAGRSQDLHRSLEGPVGRHGCTRGGNQSWSGLTKGLDPEYCDYLFVLVGDGRRWFIPSTHFGGRHGLRLGGPKYAESRWSGAIQSPAAPPLQSASPPPGGMSERPKETGCKPVGSAYAGSNPAPPIARLTAGTTPP
jgi:hypothetical protein